MIPLLGEGLALGLATGPQCLFSCAPLLVPYFLSEKRPAKQAVLLWAEFMMGRLIAYLVFALLVGWLGKRLAHQVPSFWIYGTLLASGVWMLFYAYTQHAPESSFCRWAGTSSWIRRTPLLFGFFVGLNFCPPFVAGALRILELGQPAAGTGYFAAFYLGTSVYLLPLLGMSPLAKSPRLQTIGHLACVLAGLWFTGLGIYGLFA